MKTVVQYNYDDVISTFLTQIISMSIKYTKYFLLATNHACPWIVTLNGLCDMKGKKPRSLSTVRL